MRGPPLVAGHDRMKGSANAAWITRVAKSPPVRSRSTVIASKIAAVERREARVPVKRRAAPQGADLRRCVFWRSAPLAFARDKEREGAAPRRTTSGVDESRLFVTLTMRASAGCLKCESEWSA